MMVHDLWIGGGWAVMLRSGHQTPGACWSTQPVERQCLLSPRVSRDARLQPSFIGAAHDMNLMNDLEDAPFQAQLLSSRPS